MLLCFSWLRAARNPSYAAYAVISLIPSPGIRVAVPSSPGLAQTRLGTELLCTQPVSDWRNPAQPHASITDQSASPVCPTCFVTGWLTGNGCGHRHSIICSVVGLAVQHPQGTFELLQGSVHRRMLSMLLSLGPTMRNGGTVSEQSWEKLCRLEAVPRAAFAFVACWPWCLLNLGMISQGPRWF